MPEPVFSADEVAELLERAAELQRQGKKRSAETGLTLSELEDIASESGIDPSHIREAAFELAQPRLAPVQKSTGMGNVTIIERTVKAELTPELSEDIISELRTRYESSGYAGTTYGVPGGVVYGASRIEHIGRSVEWIYTDWWGYEQRVRLQPRGDQLRIRMSAPNGWASPRVESATYASGPGVLTGILSAALGGVGWIWAIILAMLAFGIAVGFITPSLIKRRKKRYQETQKTVDWIAEYALSMTGTSKTPTGTIPVPERDEFGIQDEHTHFHGSRARS